MCDSTSLVKAKYAAAVLKVARTSEKKIAAALVEGLATEVPAYDDRPEVAQAHMQAVEIFGSLAHSIRGPAGGMSVLWEAAVEAIHKWRSQLQGLAC